MENRINFKRLLKNRTLVNAEFEYRKMIKDKAKLEKVQAIDP